MLCNSLLAENGLRYKEVAELTEHTFVEMGRSRVLGMLAGDEDQNDSDSWRTDPVLEFIADRWPSDPDLAS
jgi:hypothetical protein